MNTDVKPATGRPLSPHLQVYRLIPTMAMSIVHRITGAALYFGTLLVVWWLIAASTSEEYFNFVSTIYRSLPGQIVLFGYTWTLIHHMLGGIRHLVWDTGAGLDKATATKAAYATIIGSVLLTVFVWIAANALR
jgi:succinate dehydrogenase / fumarate reductase cytochrome b subunit